MAWVTDAPNFNGRTTPLQYRFLVAMMGSLGIGNNLNKWTSEDFGLATKMIAYYKSIQSTVQQGKLYRLFSPREGEMTVNQYVSEDGKQAVLFAFLRSQQYGRPAPTIRLRGLDERGVYRVQALDNSKLVEKLETGQRSVLAEPRPEPPPGGRLRQRLNLIGSGAIGRVDVSVVGLATCRAMPVRPINGPRHRLCSQGRGKRSLQSVAEPISRSRPAAFANARKSRSRVRRGIPRSIQLWAIRASPSRALRRFASTFDRNSPARCQ